MDGYRHTQETRALLKILALGNRQIASGRVRPAAEVVAQLRELREHRRGPRDVVSSADG
ncbi:MAG: hypothetical protein OXC12_15025 [Spirochaetaceae bacterium]|nr:hypothetical protein [Spirochaetaceae bacterium]